MRFWTISTNKEGTVYAVSFKNLKINRKKGQQWFES